MGSASDFTHFIHADRISLQYDSYGLAHADICRTAVHVLHFRQLLGRKLLKWSSQYLCGL